MTTPSYRTSVRAFALSAVVAGAAGSLSAQTVAYVGASLWDGTGAPPITHATLLVTDGRITSVGQDLTVPAGAEVVDLEGRFVIPGLIDTHAHVSGLWADSDIANAEDRVRGDLDLFATYGVTTVNSLGDGAAALAVQRSATSRDARARLFAAGPVITETGASAARAAATAIVDSGATWLKLRVDDNLGTTQKMPWDAVQAVLDVGKERGVRVATHLFYLDDAKRLLGMGTGLLAHSIRDRPVDDDFVRALRASGVCYVPTLVREMSTFVYGSRPDFFDDPFFTRHASPSQVARVSAPDFMRAMRESKAAAGYRQALTQASSNLATLVQAGLPVAFGTDAGPAGRFPGYFEHVELSLMVDAGLTPEQALLSATSAAAACLDRTDIGVLEAGRWADFVVLTADPLLDILNSRTLDRVYIAGRQIR